MHVVARVAECACAGSAAAGAAWAAAIVAGSSDGRQSIALAAPTGIIAAGALWLERAPERDAFVRRVDRRSGFSGALVTSWDWMRSARRGELGALLVARTSARLTLSDVIRGALPSSPAMFALPLFGLALVALAHPPETSATNTRLVNAGRAVSRALAQLGDEAPADLRAELAALTSAVETSATGAGAAGESATRSELAREVERLIGRSAETPELGRPLRPALEALAAALASNPGSHAPESGASPAGASLDAARGPGGAGIGAASGKSPISALARAGGDGRMSGPLERVPPPATVAVPLANATATIRAEAGSRAARWWPERFDPVVERWLDDPAGTRSPR